MSLQTIKVPDIGDYADVEVIEIMVKVGDTIQVDDPLLTLETDKATMEVPASHAGVVKKHLVSVGDRVSEGVEIMQVEASASATEDTPKEAAPAKQAEAPIAEKPAEAKPLPAPVKVEAPAKEVLTDDHASPAVRRLVRELDLTLSDIAGTGRKGRVTKEDIQNHIRKLNQGGGGTGLGLLADPVVDFAAFGEVATTPLSRIQKISGANLQRNWVKIPHVTFYEKADITDLEVFRKATKAQHDVKLTPLPFILKACAYALKQYPNFNASLSADGANLVMKAYCHIGFAVDTPNGLVVPVVRNVDQKGLLTVAEEMAALVKKAREGKLSPKDMQGGCFTVSSLGQLGTIGFTPIINMPEVAILGVSKAAIEPVYDASSGDFKPKLQLPLSLSVDHRVIDGAKAAQFISTVSSCLNDFRQVSL